VRGEESWRGVGEWGGGRLMEASGDTRPLRCMPGERGKRYEAHPHEISRARIYEDHETSVPAYLLSPTRDTCACVIVSTHTRHMCLHIRQHAHETRVPAYSSARTRDTCACVFVSTHTRHVCLRIRQHAHETRVPAFSSARTRDTCACVFVSTHTRHVCLRFLQHAHETRVPAFSSARTRLVWLSTSTLCACCVTCVLQRALDSMALDRTCCP
jgi:hypothetical protein